MSLLRIVTRRISLGCFLPQVISFKKHYLAPRASFSIMSEMYFNSYVCEYALQGERNTCDFDFRSPVEMTSLHLLVKWEGLNQSLESF